MAFIDDVEKVCKEVNEEATNWTWEDFPDIYEIGNSITLEDFKKGTKLEEFENKNKKPQEVKSGESFATNSVKIASDEVGFTIMPFSEDNIVKQP